jgi:hypothetical protein
LFAWLVRSQEHEIHVVLLEHVKLLRVFDAISHSYSCWATKEIEHLDFLGIADTSALVGVHFKFDCGARWSASS